MSKVSREQLHKDLTADPQGNLDEKLFHKTVADFRAETLSRFSPPQKLINDIFGIFIGKRTRELILQICSKDLRALTPKRARTKQAAFETVYDQITSSPVWTTFIKECEQSGLLVTLNERIDEYKEGSSTPRKRHYVLTLFVQRVSVSE